MTPEPGIYTDGPFEEYLAWDALSASMLKHFRKSPAHYKHALLNPREQTESMAFGSLVHCLVLEPGSVWDRYAVLPDGNYTTKKFKDIRDQVASDNPGKTLIKQTPFDGACNAAQAVIKHPKISPLLPAAEFEVSFVWDNAGVRCKGRADALIRKQGIVLDIKTTRSADNDSFSRVIADAGYHYQAAWYKAGLDSLEVPIDYFMFIAVENEAPYGVRVYELDTELMERAKKKTQGYLQLYKKAVDSDDWGSYPTSIDVISIPKWADEAEFGTTLEA